MRQGEVGSRHSTTLNLNKLLETAAFAISLWWFGTEDQGNLWVVRVGNICPRFHLAANYPESINL